MLAVAVHRQKLAVCMVKVYRPSHIGLGLVLRLGCLAQLFIASRINVSGKAAGSQKHWQYYRRSLSLSTSWLT